MVPIWTGNVSEYPSYPFFYGCGDLLLRSFPFPVLFRIACQPAISLKRKIKSERKSRHFQTGHAKQIEKKNEKVPIIASSYSKGLFILFSFFEKQFWVLLFEGVAAFLKKLCCAKILGKEWQGTHKKTVFTQLQYILYIQWALPP